MRARGTQKLSDLIIRVQIRSRPLRPVRQQALRRNLRPWIGGAAMARKYAHDAQSSRPLRRLNCRRLLRPGERQPGRDIGGAALLHERHEIDATLCRSPQLNPKLRRMVRYSCTAYAACSSHTSRPRQRERTQCIEIDLGVNHRGLGTAMPQHLADFGQRGAVAQHLSRQAMAKLMRADSGCLDAGARERCRTSDR